jgi:undecaprenyl-phosphate 4-deoxy-4-formamido-L-arabinose transferase
VGTACAVAGFIAGIAVVIRKLINPFISAGYSSIISVILFIGGIIMMILGVMGEYIGRIYMTVSDMPQYNVRQTINVPADKDASR